MVSTLGAVLGGSAGSSGLARGILAGEGGENEAVA